MSYDDLKSHMLSLPGATLSIQWGADRVFKVGGKMFAVMGAPEQTPHTISFKAGEDSFHILTQQKNIIPAPYLARAHWVYLERLNALSPRELKAYLVRAHALIAAGLPKKTQAALKLDKNSETKSPSSARRRRG
jgi:predicted DNA-binding protein (MmcQ/YjbR family)